MKTLTKTDLTITPTGATFGAIVIGIDASLPVSPEVVLELKQALSDYHILIFKNQTLTEVQLLKFATAFGDIFIPPGEVPVLGSKPHIPPVVVTIANAAPEYGSDGLLDNWELLPHSDHQWTPSPSSGSLLYAVEVPAQGGDTQWIDLIQAYEELDEGTKQEIENLQTIVYNPFLRSDRGTASYRLEPTNQLDRHLFPHPLVRTHPENGKKILYLNCADEVEIVGMEPQKGAKLIERLRKHINQPKFFYNHHWSVGDTVYWDNQCTLHYRAEFDKNARRVMKRVSLAGSRPF